MSKFIINFFFVIAFFVVLEGLLYIKDYNEVVVLDLYIRYDIKHKNITSFSNEKYRVNIECGEKEIKYQISYNRDSVLKLEMLKIIEYGGIV